MAWMTVNSGYLGPGWCLVASSLPGRVVNGGGVAVASVVAGNPGYLTVIFLAEFLTLVAAFLTRLGPFLL